MFSKITNPLIQEAVGRGQLGYPAPATLGPSPHSFTKQSTNVIERGGMRVPTCRVDGNIKVRIVPESKTSVDLNESTEQGGCDGKV